MDIPDEKKPDILLAALNARYTALDKIRDRVESVCLWAIGLQLAAGGWLLQSSVNYSYTKKGLLFIAIILAVWVIRYHYLEDLLKGFRAQQQTAARIESTLNLYDKDFFGSDESIYPKNWEKAGSPTSQGKYFNHSFSLLWIGTVFLAAAIIFS